MKFIMKKYLEYFTNENTCAFDDMLHKIYVYF